LLGLLIVGLSLLLIRSRSPGLLACLLVLLGPLNALILNSGRSRRRLSLRGLLLGWILGGLRV
jgi:hypothetical protein